MPLLHVVAAAVIRDGRVLAARRSRPAELAGGWEFPGGKVEADEGEPAALVRELQEELGARIQAGRRLGEATDGRVRLVLYAAAVPDDEPEAGADHDVVRWLAPTELDAPAWLPIDRDLLPLVRPLLQGGGEG